LTLTKDGVAEVSAVRALLHATEGQQLTVINEGPVFHALSTQQVICITRDKSGVATTWLGKQFSKEITLNVLRLGVTTLWLNVWLQCGYLATSGEQTRFTRASDLKCRS
tara:strand:- start:89 stop:415 length:327 start_codon:yes stop_codon:yes gene_type:complete